jgi:hemerythrin-like domain-containing protein
MPVQIGQKPESDFSNPLGLLSDCHRRIERFLGVLVRISEKRNGAELSAEEKAALETALTYFRDAAPKHTSDEEDSLFPRLREAAVAALECLENLEGDHQAAARDHEIVDLLGTRWLTDGKLASEHAVELSEALTRLSSLYTRHITIEDTELFPLAAKVLPANQLAAVGREMADRRGVR